MRKQLFLLLFAMPLFIFGQQKANYDLAARFSPKKLDKMIFSLSVDPHWLKQSNKFWYVYETSEGKQWMIVDPTKNEKKQMFDKEQLAASLTKIVKDPFDAQHLPIDSLKFFKDENWIQFEVKSSIDIDKPGAAKKDGKAEKIKKVFYFEYNLITSQLNELVGFKKPKRKPSWANIAPDQSKIVFGRNYNLYYMDKANYEKVLINEEDSTIVETPITKDGIQNFSWHSEGGAGGGGETNVDAEKNKNKRKPVFGYWSENSKQLAIVKVDNRKVKDLWVINSIADPRPTLETYKYWMPGEKEAPVDHLMLVDMTAYTNKEINVSQYKDQDISLWNKSAAVNARDDEFKPMIWLGTNEQLYLARTSRDLKKIDQCVVNTITGEVKVMVAEEMNTSIEIKKPELIKNGAELIEWSERDGWAHLYLYDGQGKLKNQITQGAWHVEEVVSVDEAKRVVYFTANGKESLSGGGKEDPYYLHFYKINLDGTGLQLLNAGNFDHSISLNYNNNYFVNNASRVNTTPVASLHSADGRKLMELETADLRSLFATGYKFPETFKVKADDGITDLYGVMYKPYDFDSTKKYPIIEYVYPGPQTESVNKTFSKGMDRIDRLAQLGFVVVTMGNRGGHPARSKWYHNYGYGNLRDYGLADKKATVEQLADKYAFIDRNKVGIHGHSGGGFMSTAAMLVYPDIFKVAVSNAGNHDNSVYNRWWSEKHHGVKETISEKGDTSFSYMIDKNPGLAKNLKGKLLLIHGEIDNNVHPANTLRVVNALIKANKRFDMLILPTQRHGFGDMNEYWFWRTADYFSKYLLGDDTERSVDIDELNKDVERKK
ncbi:MAG: DPP IV N-terminal domain-containing protein [Sediminibacterium sp.]|nr:DPP IV N-terminal domain-containing protein [Sediminibacterium sp.]MBP6144624.1 DPP IV N-terminal domain-containing protein [Sediminibacterium sp.]